jgi:hypothetical protein
MHDLIPKPRLHISLLILLALLFTGCQTTSVDKSATRANTTVEDVLIAQQYERYKEWDVAHEMYLYLARNSIQPQRSWYYQKAALMLYEDGLIDEMEAFYNALNEDALLPDDAINRDVLLAGIYLQRGKIYQTLGNLPDIEAIPNPVYKAKALDIRSQGILAIGKPLESAELRMQIGQYLQDEEEIRQNHDAIWDALNRITETSIIKALSEPQTAELRGWLELNLIARRSNMIPAKIEPWMEKWYELYPEHEAALNFTQNLLAESRLIYINPTRIALLLPFSDKFKDAAAAIQNGFLYAYYNDPQEKPALEIVNVSGDVQDFYLRYNQAIQNGADFIVGPLDKNLVNELLLNESLKVPTLTLNYADREEYGINNLYQFGLRPEDEAEQIADYALINEHYHAITLTPDNQLGVRMNKAFSERFESLGGQVVGNARYPSSRNDYSPAIKNLLNLSDSERRHSILDSINGQTSEFIPRRRQDVDMVFISGNPRQARLIKPQLKFHHAKNLPVYATSSISSGALDTDADRDLNGIKFVDTPWALNPEENADYQNVHTLWPEQSERYARFFALGLDAYRLIPSLRRLMLNPDESVSMNTGTINVDQYGRIHRELLLATYENGRAQLIKKSAEPAD